MIGAFIAWSEAKNGCTGYVIDGNGCHIWVGAIGGNGYSVAWDSINGRQGSAHRIRYEREIGPVPKGMHLDHYVCENRACCNPLHVRPVSPRENTLRGDTPASTNLARTHCSKGHPLTTENLDSWMAKRGKRKCMVCAREYCRNWRERNKDYHNRWRERSRQKGIDV